MANRPARKSQRVEACPAWVLHSYPYKETSLIVEVFSRELGRLPMVARGARRPASNLRGSLLAFQPVLLSWFGDGEMKTLHSADWQGGVAQLSGLPLLCGFYLNELLLRLLAKEDAHPVLFDAYSTTVRGLAVAGQSELEPLLRCFEFTLLGQLGYGVDPTIDRHGQLIQPDRAYRFLHGTGVVPAESADDDRGIAIAGRTLLAMGRADYREPQVAGQAKMLMRALLGELLGPRPLHTRQLLRDLQR